MPTVSATSLTIAGGPTEFGDRILTPEALEFVARLQQEFGATRARLLARRRERLAAVEAGQTLDFLPETAGVRAGDWRVAPAPPDLDDRRVEITGPVDRKMMINALNSGAKVFMADLEDALSPTWPNVVDGQWNLCEAVRGTLALETDEKRYALGESLATLVVRPRGWHLLERNALLNGEPVSASLFDFGLYFFHNARARVERGTAPYFYLPKMESHLEARLWNDVFNFAQDALSIPRGTVRATVLIETIWAAYEMEEILHELRDHAAGLNAGRWDYLFSVIKTFRNDPAAILPDRAQLTMTVPFMRAYTELLVKTCHKRGAHAIGGMAAFIPNRRDAEVTARATTKVLEDKQRESRDGFDGTWVAHPDLVPLARETFDAVLGDRPNQKDRLRDEVVADGAALRRFAVEGGRVTREGVRTNIDVALRYIEAWLRGIGAVAIHNLMEDAATAEISRSQLWQWRENGVALAEGGTMTANTYESIRDEVLAVLAAEQGLTRLRDAAILLDRLVLGQFEDFLTVPGSELLAAPTTQRAT
ncbi:MAG TPA: malate synthase A [Gemmatimonadaceae bacterium]|nr:malate synthase A [Gemmatimonadaceae bacterium]